MAVCCRAPFTCVTQTYWVSAGTTIGATVCGTADFAMAAVPGAIVAGAGSTGRRTTAAPGISAEGVRGTGAGGAAHEATNAAATMIIVRFIRDLLLAGKTEACAERRGRARRLMSPALATI